MQISRTLTDWYRLNHRQLPWRQTDSPYLIWLSEIILQQTRVEQGLNYFLKFQSEFPTIIDLANAPEDKVMKLWQGLGYYSRARNLHHTAQIIRDQYNGQFPNTYREIIKLKGVGTYTAAAIASFAFGQAKAVVDGNVFRVLARLYGIDTPIDTTLGKKQFEHLANQLLNKKQPHLHNQAIMEFGAMHCTHKNPKCADCPLKIHCVALKEGTIELLPQKKSKTKVTNLYLYYIVPVFNGNTFVKKRLEKGMWQNLYEFPVIETMEKTTVEDFLAQNKIGRLLKTDDFEILRISQIYTHILSHRKITAVFFIVKIHTSHFSQRVYKQTDIATLAELGVSRLTDKFLQEHNLGLFLT